jgi:hypothetical protein
MRDTVRRLAALAGLVGLTACGGGGSDTPTPDPGGLCASGARFAVVSTAAPTPGKNAAAAVVGCGGAIANPQWTQTAGPAVALLSDRTQTISFEPPAAGSYAFRLSFRDPAGADRTQDVTVAASGAAAATQLTLRVSQSVRMGGKVSVRAWPTLAGGETFESITWTQVEGPAVTLDTRDPYVALFVAPDVAGDTPIRLRATLRTTSGLTDTDEALVLVERHVQAPASDADAVWGGDHVSRVYAFKRTGPYAAVLAGCVYESNLRYRGAQQNTCALTRLPFLAQDSGGGVPTVEQVMDRVVVSHDWLGRNFEDFLRTQDTRGDFRRMLNSVTAVVLGAQVRPSFYYPLTGAIYLDGNNFWLTPDERDTVNEAPDFRSDFGSDLQYSDLWRYTQNNRSIFVFFSPRSRVNRDVSYLLNESGWLMFHELGHALDFLPPSQYAGLNRTLDPWGNIGPRYANRQLTSDLVTAAFPLQSPEMAGLGQVKFQGLSASATQRSYTPDQVAGFFSADRATDEYNYSTTREDVAMSLEEFLMQHRLGILRDKAILDKITSTTTSSTAIVRWGQRGRVGQPDIKPRVRAIVEQLMPWLNPNDVEALPAPLALRAGESWSANLAVPAIPRAARLQAAEPTLLELWQFQKEVQRVAQRRHAQAKRLPER